MKSLGKADTTSIPATNKELEAWPAAVDQSGPSGKFKVWEYQHDILHPTDSRAPLGLRGPDLLVEGFERRVSRVPMEVTGTVREFSVLLEGMLSLQ